MKKSKSDWAGLSPDLIRLISAKFTKLSDFVRFKYVCKHWRDFASIEDLPKQFPWILKSLYPEPDSYFCFYTNSFKPKTFHVPDVSSNDGSIVRSSSDGYLASYDSFASSLFCINPLTKKMIYLPPLKMQWCNPIYIGEEMIVFIYNITEDISKSKMLGLFTPEDTELKKIEGSYKSYGHLYYDKKCYVYKQDGSLEIRDTVTGDFLSEIRPICTTTRPDICEKLIGGNYLVALDNEIFQVYRVCDDNLPLEQCYFDVHKLESGAEGNFKWVRVSNIGDNMLFVDSVRVFGLKAGDFEGYKGNCIYFVKYENIYSEWICFLCRYDIEEGRVEKLPYLIEGNTWFMPTLV